jgi:choline dehydrogenase-like flavoprotein
VIEGVSRPRDDEMTDPAYLATWIQRNGATGAHPSCTAMMGAADDEMGVCNERGFVRGVQNLRIADASLMPVVPRVNTNIPTIMIGERMGEWTREELAPA